MTGYGEKLSDAEIWALVLYMRNFLDDTAKQSR
jgi:hypothetical protein